jgi:hypothetical protein
VPELEDRPEMVGCGFTVTVAEALLVASATLVAVTVTVCWLATAGGAVYRPELPMVPVAGLRLHVTVVLAVFVTMAVNCCVCEGERVAVKGVTLTVTGGANVTVAEAVLVLSAALVAVTVTVCWLAIDAGAVYSPVPSTVPVLGFRLQVTVVLAEPVTVAVNCWVWDADKAAVAGVTLTVTAGINVTVAVALLVGSATLVAVTETVRWLAIVAGAV